MSDLLDSVRAVNPVLSCEQPPVADVWRKLAQDAPAASTETRPRRRLGATVAMSAAFAAMAAAVVLVVAGLQGGVAHTGPAQLAQPSAAVRRLADGTITCDFRSTGASGAPAVASVSARGRSAIVFCRNRYLAMEHRGADASGVRFIACQTSASNVAVFISDERPDQCGRRGDRALPAGYAAAVRDSGSHTAAVSNSENAGVLSV